VATVVPNRNLLFLSLAGAVAVGSGLKTVLFSAHAGDAAVYPDCRPEFVAAADRALGLACGVGVEAPFLAMTKGEIVALGRELGVPLERTWSCYLGGEEPCGRCGACVERGEAGA
jgi:7-cyano-7-deazaguanine synthase